jgi:hypothetical protein
MAITRKTPFRKLVPDDIAEMFRELKLKAPNPLWYVGRLDEREAITPEQKNGNGASGHASTANGNGNGNAPPAADDHD